MTDSRRNRQIDRLSDKEAIELDNDDEQTFQHLTNISSFRIFALHLTWSLFNMSIDKLPHALHFYLMHSQPFQATERYVRISNRICYFGVTGFTKEAAKKKKKCPPWS